MFGTDTKDRNHEVELKRKLFSCFCFLGVAEGASHNKRDPRDAHVVRLVVALVFFSRD